VNTSEPRVVRRILSAWLPAASYMGLIWLLSSGPVPIPIDALPFKDKGAHIIEYGILAALNAFAIRGTLLGIRLRGVLLRAVALTFVWGYLDELHQAFVPGRNCDAFDLLADTIGACAGAGCFWLAERLWRARQS
jgi:VanZ family protein